MTIAEFKSRLLPAIAASFPDAPLEVEERRATVLQARVQVDEETLIDVYFNSLTGKTSYMLIHGEQRVLGYDNYRFWHCHPFDRPQKHIPCDEPAMEDVIAEMKEAVERLWE